MQALQKALFKKAIGFTYKEKVYEYEVESDKPTAPTVATKEIDTKNHCAENSSTENECCKHGLEQNGTLLQKTENSGVQCSQSVKRGRGRPKGSTSKHVLKLVKTKVASHYVPPDMVALKLLLEQHKRQQSETLTDAMLLALKNEIDEQLEKGEYIHDTEKSEG